MNRLAPLITAVGSGLLALFVFAFFPWQDNLFGDVGWFGVPLWIACVAVAPGLAATTAHLLRGAIGR